MATEWQRALPIAQESVRVPHESQRVLWRSGRFTKEDTRLGPYQVAVLARWDDSCGNGSNSFYIRTAVLLDGSLRESERCDVLDAPEEVEKSIPAHFLAMQKYNGFHPFGPWYYLENTLYNVGDKDCHGLRKGESRQVRNGKTGLPCWKLGFADGAKPETYIDAAEQPTQAYVMKYLPLLREGEGKQRELNLARISACWPEATDEELLAEDLEERLKARLPGLLSEFRKALEGLGFQW